MWASGGIPPPRPPRPHRRTTPINIFALHLAPLLGGGGGSLLLPSHRPSPHAPSLSPFVPPPRPPGFIRPPPSPPSPPSPEKEEVDGWPRRRAWRGDQIQGVRDVHGGPTHPRMVDPCHSQQDLRHVGQLCNLPQLYHPRPQHAVCKVLRWVRKKKNERSRKRKRVAQVETQSREQAQRANPERRIGRRGREAPRLLHMRRVGGGAGEE